ncbi:hypothetical protein Tco_1373471 [Tanacetum coccineum]
MRGSYYSIPCSILSTGKNRKTPQRYPDFPTTSWRIFIRSLDSGKLRDLNAKESWALFEDLALYDNESWNDLRDFAKPVKEITLPQDVPMVLMTLSISWKILNKPFLNTHPRIPMKREQPEESQVNEPDIGSLGNIRSNPHPQPDPLASIATEQRFVCTKEEDGEVMFIEIIQDNDESQNESPNEGWIKGMHVFIGNFTYVVDFMIIEDISSIIDPRFANRDDEVAYKMPHKIEQYNLLSNLEKEHIKSVYLRNKEDKRRGVDYVMGKILGFYKECLELGPEYVTGIDDEGEVT